MRNGLEKDGTLISTGNILFDLRAASQDQQLIQSAFEHLVVAAKNGTLEYIAGAARARRFDKCSFQNGSVEWLSDGYCTESDTYEYFIENRFNEEMPERRSYRAIRKVKNSEVFVKSVVWQMNELGRICIDPKDKLQISLHTISYFPTTASPCLPTPARPHQDGVGITSIFTLGLENVKPPRLSFFADMNEDGRLDLRNSTDKYILSAQPLAVGDYIIWNDRYLFHDVEPTSLILGSDSGVRTIAILDATPV